MRNSAFWFVCWLCSEVSPFTTFDFDYPHFISTFHSFITLRLLEQWCLQEHPFTTFFESKRFSSFFANGPIKFKVQLFNHWKLTVWTYLTSKETALKFMNVVIIIKIIIIYNYNNNNNNDNTKIVLSPSSSFQG